MILRLCYKMYRLLDGRQHNKKHPHTFLIPSSSDISKLIVGDYVQLCFEEDGKDSEKMWVRLTMIDEGSCFEGCLDNDPFKLTYVSYGELIEFNSKHIIKIL